MESIQPEVLRSAIKEVWIRALTEVQPDVLNALVKARAEETNPRGQQYLDILIENAKKTPRKIASSFVRIRGFQPSLLKPPSAFPLLEISALSLTVP